MELLNSLEVADPDAGYFDDGGITLVYWFRYADGDARAVSYEAFGGHTIATGETQERVGGADLATAFSDALAASAAPHSRLRRPAGPTATSTRVATPRCR